MIKLLADGTDITSQISDRLVGLTLTDERDGSVDQLDIEISNHDLALTLPKPKASLQLWLADADGQLVEMGTYHVDSSELSGRDRIITIIARSADITDSLRVRREISYEETTLGDIVTQIASRNALEAVVSTALASVGIDHFDQTSESDLSVLERLGDLYDAIATVKAGRILFKEAGTGTTASGAELPSVELDAIGNEDWRLRLESSSYTGVIGYWNDTAGAERVEISVGTDVNPLHIRGTFRSEAQCKTAVDSRWKQLQRSQSVFSITTSLNPYAVPDSPLNFSGDWPDEVTSESLIIRRVTHRLPATTEIEAELATGSGS